MIELENQVDRHGDKIEYLHAALQLVIGQLIIISPPALQDELQSISKSLEEDLI